jgi:hypothetical protein
MAIREEVDQDDRGNDLTSQNRPEVEHAQQQDSTPDEIEGLESEMVNVDAFVPRDVHCGQYMSHFF